LLPGGAITKMQVSHIQNPEYAKPATPGGVIYTGNDLPAGPEVETDVIKWETLTAAHILLSISYCPDFSV
jgi:hypothetical protein